MLEARNDNDIYATQPLVAAQTPIDEPPLTGEELLRLVSVSARFNFHPECIELGLDEYRLAFARWLVDHGRLSEGL